MEIKKAIFAAGCFWGVETNFRKVEGVISTRVGYTGGHFKNPSYKQVCTINTGHAEAIEIFFDASKVSYDELLEVFWSIHDPTTLNSQGPDIGEQYRSVIFYIDVEQKGHEYWISVIDTGIGIPEAEYNRIFDQFHQVEPSLTRKFEGMGLGLSIAKGMVDIHKGRIWVESVVGKGSKFTIVFPTAPDVAND